MQIKDHALGTELETPLCTLFFGKKGSSREALKESFPQYEQAWVKQVHGTALCEATSAGFQNCEADALITDKSKIALLIATADCMPVSIIDPVAKRIAAIHSGWRGVAQRIVPLSLKKMQSLGSKLGHLQIFVGPHILFPSFEVGEDVKNLLIKSALLAPSQDETIVKPLSEGKFLVNLKDLLEFQLREFDLSNEQIWFEYKNTFALPDYHSHRRDKEKAGRQLSFIALK